MRRKPRARRRCTSVRRIWLPQLDAGYDPQGLAVDDGAIYVSAYRSDNLGVRRGPCRVIRIDLETGGSTGYVDVPSPCGPRRFDIVGRLLPKQNPSDGVLRAELTLRAFAGFKGETSEDGDPDDAPRKVELSVDEARMVPLSITVPVFSLPLVVQFQRLCAAPDPCTE